MKVKLCEKCRKVNEKCLGKIVYIQKFTNGHISFHSMLYKLNEGKSVREVAKELKTYPQRINEILKEKNIKKTVEWRQVK